MSEAISYYTRTKEEKSEDSGIESGNFFLVSHAEIFNTKYEKSMNEDNYIWSIHLL